MKVQNTTVDGLRWLKSVRDSVSTSTTIQSALQKANEVKYLVLVVGTSTRYDTWYYRTRGRYGETAFASPTAKHVSQFFPRTNESAFCIATSSCHSPSPKSTGMKCKSFRRTSHSLPWQNEWILETDSEWTRYGVTCCNSELCRQVSTSIHIAINSPSNQKIINHVQSTCII